jgi:hypothetical protein
LRRKYRAVCTDGDNRRRTPSFFGKLPNAEPLTKLAFAKARLNFLAALASGFLCSEAALVNVVIYSWAEAPQSATKTQKHNPIS